MPEGAVGTASPWSSVRLRDGPGEAAERRRWSSTGDARPNSVALRKVEEEDPDGPGAPADV
jgi:hypothetical protein